MHITLRNKKKRHLDEDKLKYKDQEEAAKIYAEYIRSFEPEEDVGTNTFVKKTVLNPSNQNTVYLENGQKRGKHKVENDKNVSTTGKSCEKEQDNKNNKQVKEIDSFLEEIKQKQKIWDEKKHLQERIEQDISTEEKNEIRKRLKEIEKNDMIASYYPKREMFANLFLNNLSPEVTEEFLCKKFGAFGPIHSIKIMYPRTEEERRRNRISGFVCFENKEDAELAKDTLNRTEILGHVVKIGWSKAIPKMTNEKKEINDLLMSLNKNKTSESGNVTARTANELTEPKTKGAVDSCTSNSKRDQKMNYKMVELKIPEDKKVKEVIDLLAEYVTEAGYIFEEAIKKREKQNSLFSFLFDESDLSNYYRWRVYSLSQGDTVQNWRTDPFQIFRNGTIYIPPPLKKKVIRKTDVKRQKNVQLKKYQKQKLISILERLSKKRVSICRAMIFCAKHSDATTDVVKIIADFLTDMKQDLMKKVNVMYLLSDLLHNCSNEFYSLWSYRKHVEMELPRIFYYLKKHLKKCDSKVKAKLFVDSVMNLFSIWENWALYNFFFMNGLKCFLCYQKINIQKNEMDESLYNKDLDGEKITFFDEVKVYPLHLRKKAFLYFKQEENQINRLCEQRGLYYDKNFTKMKKIKYLITYDEFCANTNMIFSKKEFSAYNMDDGKHVNRFNAQFNARAERVV